MIDWEPIYFQLLKNVVKLTLMGTYCVYLLALVQYIIEAWKLTLWLQKLDPRVKFTLKSAKSGVFGMPIQPEEICKCQISLLFLDLELWNV